MGTPKAWLPFGLETMLQRTVRTLSSEVSRIVVVAAVDQDLPPLPADVLVVRDARPDRGPLEGLSMGLQALTPAHAAFVTSCDVPRLQPEFVRYLLAHLGDYDIVVPQDDTYSHPLAAVYRQQVLPHVRELLASDQLRPLFLFRRVATCFIPVAELRAVDPELMSLDNLNSPEDYQRALRAAGLGP